MIRVDGVTKVYVTSSKKGFFQKRKVEKVAVQNLSLELHPGEIVGLLGLNGAGKTTTIKMLSTLLLPTSGTITIDGLDIDRDRRQIQDRINMIAGGERMLYWRLTGRENLFYFGRLYGMAETELESRAEALLTEVGLQEAADLPVEQYSKGMKQRLQIARGLINDPAYLFLDEPTLGLDAPIARQLRQTVKSLAAEKGKGILLTSHYLQEVEELCDRVYVIDRGRLILCDTPQEIVRKAAGYQVVHVGLQGWKESAAARLPHLFDLPSDALTVQAGEEEGSVTLSVKAESADQLIPRLLPWLAQQGMTVLQLSTEKPTLEDAIIRLSEGGGGDAAVLASVSG